MFEDIPFETSEVVVGSPARLLIFSDGVFEIDQPDGNMWTFEEFLAFVSPLQATAAVMADPLLSHVQQLHGSTTLTDDFSILQIDFA